MFEAAAAPITSPLIAPMIFLIAGLVCTALALAAFLTPQYRLLAEQYDSAAPADVPGDPDGPAPDSAPAGRPHEPDS